MYDKKAHYLIEKDLAAALRRASRQERRTLYTKVYDALFASVPEHPQLVSPDEDGDRRENRSRLKLLEPYAGKDKICSEFGAGDGSFCNLIAVLFRKVYAVDCSRILDEKNPLEQNVERVVCDCSDREGLPDAVDVACSANLLEHLHPEDFQSHLVNVFHMLRNGGVYYILVPNKCGGPNDISRDFDEVATCFHLNECTVTEMVDHLARAGFRNNLVYLCASYRSVRVPLWLVRPVEKMLMRLPAKLRKALMRTRFLRPLNQIRILAFKP